MRWFDRVRAVGYDVCMRAVDRRGVAAARDELVADLGGRVLEIGAGTGLTFRHYRQADEVVAVEPDPAFRARAQAAAHEAAVPVTVVAANGEHLPYPDASFDHVVVFLVLCTIPDLDGALREVRRVLRPDGRLHLYEHVRSADERLARWQDRLRRPWAAVAGGCQCNRETGDALRRAGFALAVDHADMPASLPLTRPVLRGTARAIPADELVAATR